MADYLFDGEETIATLVCGVDEAGRGLWPDRLLLQP